MDAKEKKHFFERLREERRRERAAVASFVQAVADGDARAMGKAVCEVDAHFLWKPALRALVRRGIEGSEEVRRQFLDIYVRSGDHIRGEAGDDLLLVDALRLLVPPYQGPGLKLFRGDSFLNRRRRTYGLSWSDDIEIARGFAEGMWRTGDGGSVLLAVEAGAEAIICAPAIHADHYGEREFIVDRRRLKGIRVGARYPQMSHEEYARSGRMVD